MAVVCVNCLHVSALFLRVVSAFAPFFVFSAVEVLDLGLAKGQKPRANGLVFLAICAGCSNVAARGEG